MSKSSNRFSMASIIEKGCWLHSENFVGDNHHTLALDLGDNYHTLARNLPDSSTLLSADHDESMLLFPRLFEALNHAGGINRAHKSW
jgi:hypothetical protein